MKQKAPETPIQNQARKEKKSKEKKKVSFHHVHATSI